MKFLLILGHVGIIDDTEVDQVVKEASHLPRVSFKIPSYQPSLANLKCFI